MDFFVTSTPMKGISPGRPKPGSSRLQGIFKRGKGRVAPSSAPLSPLVVGNTAAVAKETREEVSPDSGTEKPLYSQVQKEPRHEIIAIQPAPQEENAQPQPQSPARGRQTSSSKEVLGETLASIPPPVCPPPYKKKQQPQDGYGSTSSEGRASSTADSTSSSDQLNETSPVSPLEA